MKHRAEELVSRRGLDEREIKRGPGGIRDIEFTVQLLQLVHGHADPDLRSPNTLAGPRRDGRGPATSTRTTPASWSTPTASCAPSSTACSWSTSSRSTPCPTTPSRSTTWPGCMGYRDTPAGDASEALWRRPAPPAARPSGPSTSASTSARCSRPSPRPTGALSPEAAVARLVAFGFTDARRTQAAVRELTRGPQPHQSPHAAAAAADARLAVDLARSRSRPAAAAQPAVGQAAPDHPGRGLPRVTRGRPAAVHRSSAPAGCSATPLARNPDLVARLPERRPTGHPARGPSWWPAPRSAACWRHDPDERQEALRRWNERNRLGIAARDLFELADVAHRRTRPDRARRGRGRGRAGRRSSRRCRSRWWPWAASAAPS